MLVKQTTREILTWVPLCRCASERFPMIRSWTPPDFEEADDVLSLSGMIWTSPIVASFIKQEDKVRGIFIHQYQIPSKTHKRTWRAPATNSISTQRSSISHPIDSIPTIGSSHKDDDAHYGLGESFFFLYVEGEDDNQGIDSNQDLGSSWGSDFLEEVRSCARRPEQKQDDNTTAKGQTNSSEHSASKSTATTNFSRRLGSTLDPAAEPWHPASREKKSDAKQTWSQASTQNGRK